MCLIAQNWWFSRGHINQYLSFGLIKTILFQVLFRTEKYEMFSYKTRLQTTRKSSRSRLFCLFDTTYPEMNVTTLDNACDSSRHTAACLRSIPEAALCCALLKICGSSIFDRSRLTLHRANRAAQEVRASQSVFKIKHPV